MNIISIVDSHTSSASLICDGIIEVLVSEERFTRRKGQISYPKNSINYCLKILGNRKLDLVLFNGKIAPDPFSIRLSRSNNYTVNDWVNEQYEFQKLILIDKEKISKVKKRYFLKMQKKLKYPQTNYLGINNAKWAYDGSDKDRKLFRKIQIKTLKKHLNIEESKLIFSEHHPSHAAYAYFASPFRGKKSLIFTMDSVGEKINATISIANNDKIKEVFRTGNCNLGRLWKYLTLLLCMKPDEHEYKVMGLAPYSDRYYSNKVNNLLKKNFQIVKGHNFVKVGKTKDIYFSFKKIFEPFRFDNIAGGLQIYTEEIVSKWIKFAVKKYKINRVVFSGGVSMNIKLNKCISEIKSIRNFYVPASGGDESLALGNYYNVFGGPKTKYFDNIYLGPEYNNEQIISSIKKMKKKNYIIKKNVSNKVVAQYLAKGYIGARFSGKMEFGARALGNRSIIADPSKIEVLKKINKQIKNRDFWMPFTPTILDKSLKRYIKNPKKIFSPHMTVAFDTTLLGRSHLQAAIHQYDLTARPQMLKRSFNKKYYDLINEFYKLTGVGGLLNTSFNLHGFPIVMSPSDAMHVFNNSELDMLIFDKYLILRNKKLV